VSLINGGGFEPSEWKIKQTRGWGQKEKKSSWARSIPGFVTTAQPLMWGLGGGGGVFLVAIRLQYEESRRLGKNESQSAEASHQGGRKLCSFIRWGPYRVYFCILFEAQQLGGKIKKGPLFGVNARRGGEMKKKKKKK